MKEGLELKADNIVYLMEEITIKEEAVWLKEEKCDDDEASAVEDPLEDIVIKTEPIKVEAVEISQDVGVDLNNRGRNSDGTFVDLGDCQSVLDRDISRISSPLNVMFQESPVHQATIMKSICN
ncbi:uncharacterized protein [Anabrus simplex]|uniref:uncharacterized protein isoform X4 n=1 Tax=Anabrus simplex TaxID=316456 RepID=UPI0034DD7571